MWILSTILVACVAHITVGQTCTSSSCCVAGQCCRDTVSGYNLINSPEGPFEELLGEGTHGQCVVGTSGAGELCDDVCQCAAGYECYRRISGVCCAPRTCITVAEANADRDYWRCRPPPPRKRRANVPRSVLFQSLCPELPMSPAGGPVEIAP